MSRILRVDMENLRIKEDAVKPEYERLGGRGLTSRIVFKEVPPTCHPLSRKNKIILAPGLLTGTKAPCSARLSVGAKSPLTGGIKESNVGGTSSFAMAKLGIKALIIENFPQTNDLYLLKVSKDSIDLINANEYRGLGNYELSRKLRAKYGRKSSILSIGPAGEMRLSASSIASTDPKGNPSRQAARGGLGAVMGSKGIKAIIIDDEGADANIPFYDEKSFDQKSKTFAKHLVKAKAGLTQYGTAIMVATANALGGMASYNFKYGSFEGVERINGEMLFQTIKERNGLPSHPCMPGCVIRCSNLYRDKSGRYLTSALEYETIVLFGSNCGIDDLDVIATLDRLCDDYGLDTIDTGVTMGLAMESGLLEFGDGKAAIELLKEVGKRSVLGRVIGSGAAVFAKVMGLWRVPEVKGQSTVAYDPRTFKGMGVSFATSPMGADHTSGPAIPGRGGLDERKKYELTEAEGQTELSRDLQIMIAVCDSMGWCFFVGPDPNTMRLTARLLNAKNNWNLTVDDVVEMGKETLRIEKQFNLNAGISPVQDRLPDFFYEEAQPPSGRTFDVPSEELKNVLNF